MTHRVIKFRAWDNVLKFMVPNFDNWIDFDGNYWTTPDITGDSKGTEIVRAHNYTIMQFTGLLDKHGKEIYEGDIIKCDIIERENHDDYSSGKPIKVYWDEECAGFYPFIKASQWRSEVYDIEKLGDIYTTPELVDPKMIER